MTLKIKSALLWHFNRCFCGISVGVFAKAIFTHDRICRIRKRRPLWSPLLFMAHFVRHDIPHLQFRYFHATDRYSDSDSHRLPRHPDIAAGLLTDTFLRRRSPFSGVLQEGSLVPSYRPGRDADCLFHRLQHLRGEGQRHIQRHHAGILRRLHRRPDFRHTSAFI